MELITTGYLIQKVISIRYVRHWNRCIVASNWKFILMSRVFRYIPETFWMALKQVKNI